MSDKVYLDFVEDRRIAGDDEETIARKIAEAATNPVCPFCKSNPATLLCDFLIGFLWSGEILPSHIGITLSDGRHSSIPNPNGDHYRVVEGRTPEMFTCDRPICRECAKHIGNIFFSGKDSGVETRDHCPQCSEDTQEEDLNPITKIEATELRKKMWSRSVGILKAVAILLLCSATALASTPHVDQESRWRAATVNPKCRIALDVAVALYQRNEWRYQQIANMRPGTVPPYVLFCLHGRESDWNFKCSPAQGDSLQRRSIHVPKNRIPDKEPPYDFTTSAVDSWFVCDRLDLKDWKHLQTALQAMSDFNGTGYDHPGKPPTPYLWAGTSLYGPPWGKYVADGHYSPTAHDGQLGCCAWLKAMQSHGIDVSPLPWPKAQP